MDGKLIFMIKIKDHDQSEIPIMELLNNNC
jgi:hypothetical protein